MVVSRPTSQNQEDRKISKEKPSASPNTKERRVKYEESSPSRPPSASATRKSLGTFTRATAGKSGELKRATLQAQTSRSGNVAKKGRRKKTTTWGQFEKKIPRVFLF